MKLRTKVGQVFLNHPKDENFTSLYEEAFSKQGQTVELFVVLEIAESGPNLSRIRKAEYEQMAQMLVQAFKKSYVTAPVLDHGTFEKALAAVNAALSRLAGRGKVSWYGKLNAAVAALIQNQLSLSVTGNAVVQLARKGEFTLLSDGLTEDVSQPIKLFANYSSGRLSGGDRVIVSTNQLVNYLSLDRIREALGEDTLEDTCQDIIGALVEVKNIGFATFIFEVNSPGAVQDTEAIPARPSLPRETIAATTKRRPTTIPASGFWPVAGRYAWTAVKFIWEVLTNLVGSLIAFVVTFFRKRPKKYLFYAIAIVLVLLLLNIGWTTLRRSAYEKTAQQASLLTQADQKLSDAEAALVYKDQNKATSLMNDAESLLAQASSSQDPQKYQALQKRVSDLKNKLNNEIHVDNPTTLAQFPSQPKNLSHSPTGFLGFNPDTSTVSFYDFRSAQSKAQLANQNTSNLLAVDFAGSPFPYVFLGRDGNFQTFDPANDSLAAFSATPTSTINLASAKIKTMDILGEGNSARIYLLDTEQTQIWRFKITDKGVAAPEAWLKTPEPALNGAVDMAIDGNIYILYPDHLDKYQTGDKQSFALATVSPPLKKAVKVFTRPEDQFIYILDPENGRILVFTKTGAFREQITSAKFHDLSDLFADEKNKLLYVLSGSELLQINL